MTQQNSNLATKCELTTLCVERGGGGLNFVGNISMT